MTKIFNPKDLGEQLEVCIRTVLDNDLYYDSLKHLPNRLNACAIKLFMEHDKWEPYYAKVIRAAITELDVKGQLNMSDKPYKF